MDKVLPRLRKLFGDRMMTRHQVIDGKLINIRVGMASDSGRHFYVYGKADTWEEATKAAETRVGKSENPLFSEDIS